MKAKKSLGQNFLIDNDVIRRIVQSARIAKDDLVLEIGPGQGALTTLLVEKAAFVWAVELDTDLAAVLEEKFTQENLQVIEADILKLDLVSLIAERSNPPANLRVVANLPYYISTAILSVLIHNRNLIKDMTLMLQREVAERIASPPGCREYGAISVLTQLYFEPHILFHVKPGSFRPIPKVESSILQLITRPQTATVDEQLLERVVFGAFAQRRKTIANSLKATATTIDKSLQSDQIIEILTTAGIAPERRAETLSCEEFVALTQACQKRCT